jgi:hypothetical protein
MMMARSPPLDPGLGPATHIFFRSGIAQQADVDARDKPTAVRLSKVGCKTELNYNYRYPLAGLDPAIHVFFWLHRAGGKWIAGPSPAKGIFRRQIRSRPPKTGHVNRTAAGQARAREFVG